MSKPYDKEPTFKDAIFSLCDIFNCNLEIDKKGNVKVEKR